jgi:hypothetical protein
MTHDRHDHAPMPNICRWEIRGQDDTVLDGASPEWGKMARQWGWKDPGQRTARRIKVAHTIFVGHVRSGDHGETQPLVRGRIVCSDPEVSGDHILPLKAARKDPSAGA